MADGRPGRRRCVLLLLPLPFPLVSFNSPLSSALALPRSRAPARRASLILVDALDSVTTSSCRSLAGPAPSLLPAPSSLLPAPSSLLPAPSSLYPEPPHPLGAASLARLRLQWQARVAAASDLLRAYQQVLNARGTNPVAARKYAVLLKVRPHRRRPLGLRARPLKGTVAVVVPSRWAQERATLQDALDATRATLDQQRASLVAAIAAADASAQRHGPRPLSVADLLAEAKQCRCELSASDERKHERVHLPPPLTALPPPPRPAPPRPPPPRTAPNPPNPPRPRQSLQTFTDDAATPGKVLVILSGLELVVDVRNRQARPHAQSPSPP